MRTGPSLTHLVVRVDLHLVLAALGLLMPQVLLNDAPGSSRTGVSVAGVHRSTVATRVRGRQGTRPTRTGTRAPKIALMRSIRGSSGVRTISGACWCGMSPQKVKRLYRRTQAPGRVRPARPRRCFAAARLHQVSARTLNPRAASCRLSFTLPKSITYCTSSIVKLVSATFVARITLTEFLGGRANTLRCSRGGSEPCRGNTRSR